MKVPLFFCLLVFCFLTSAKEGSLFEDKIRPLLMDYCFDCHDPDDDDSESPFLEALKLEDISKSRHVWESVASQLRNRTMPPKRKKKQPTEKQRLLLSNWIDGYLRTSALNMPEYAGGVTSRRLNRDEYDNSIRDLTGLEFGFSDSLPMDGAGGEGFNNNGETLFLPPLLMERYMESAQQILDRAVISPPFKFVLPKNSWILKNKKIEAEVKLGEDVHQVISIPNNGSYTFKFQVKSEGQGTWNLVLKSNDIFAYRFKLTGGKTVDLKATLNLSRGIYKIALEKPDFTKKSLLVKASVSSESINPEADVVKAHRKIFVKPAGQTEESQKMAAEHNIKAFADKAFRRALKGDELKVFMKLYDRAKSRGDSYEDSVKLALKAILVSPLFLFMIEDIPKSKGVHRINDFELATRLSYFLWSSIPDEELTRLAHNGKLHDKKVLAQQVERMLKDAKSSEFFKNFTGQWLGTKEVGAKISPVNNKKDQKDQGYTSNLGFALRNEPNHLLSYIFSNNRSLLELLNADYVVINNVLAKTYQIKGVKGSRFRKVSVTDGRRGGLLGLGGVHMVTSFPQRTSPVLRGAWILETLLGTHVPSPPDNIPPLNTENKKTKKLSIKEKLAIHRDKKGCATCHDLIDPMGFALENYDILGRWRDKEKNGAKIDSSGVMPTGEKFNGPHELRTILLTRKDEFSRHLIRKILGYALGRSLLVQDEGTIERILIELKKADYSSQKLISLIVFSTPFRNREMVSKVKSKSKKH